MLRAAKYLGVAPWDLASQPLYWTLMAEEGQDAEAFLEKQQQSKQPKQH